MRSLYARTRFLRCKRLRARAFRARILTRLQNQFLQEENPQIRSGLRMACRTVALCQTDSLPSPDPAFSECILKRLEDVIRKEHDPWVRDDLRIAWITVKWAQEGIPEWSCF